MNDNFQSETVTPRFCNRSSHLKRKGGNKKQYCKCATYVNAKRHAFFHRDPLGLSIKYVTLFLTIMNPPPPPPPPRHALSHTDGILNVCIVTLTETPPPPLPLARDVLYGRPQLFWLFYNEDPPGSK